MEIKGELPYRAINRNRRPALAAMVTLPHVTRMAPTLSQWKHHECPIDHPVTKSLTPHTNESDRTNGDDFPQPVEWAERFLTVHEETEVANARREDLLGQEMPGVRAGGLAGFTGERLSSVYGQVLLQVLLAMRGKARMGDRLVKVGLQSDMPHVPNVAREVVAGCEDEKASDA